MFTTHTGDAGIKVDQEQPRGTAHFLAEPLGGNLEKEPERQGWCSENSSRSDFPIGPPWASVFPSVKWGEGYLSDSVIGSNNHRDSTLQSCGVSENEASWGSTVQGLLLQAGKAPKCPSTCCARRGTSGGASVPLPDDCEITVCAM